jgi:hypothetical protein
MNKELLNLLRLIAEHLNESGTLHAGALSPDSETETVRDALNRLLKEVKVSLPPRLRKTYLAQGDCFRDEQGNKFNVGASCGREVGFAHCVTHHVTLKTPLNAASHYDIPGPHLRVWFCTYCQDFETFKKHPSTVKYASIREAQS